MPWGKIEKERLSRRALILQLCAMCIHSSSSIKHQVLPDSLNKSPLFNSNAQKIMTENKLSVSIDEFQRDWEHWRQEPPNRDSKNIKQYFWVRFVGKKKKNELLRIHASSS